MERASGANAYGIFFIIALLFSSSLALPLSSYGSSNSNVPYFVTVPRGGLLPEIFSSANPNGVAGMATHGASPLFPQMSSSQPINYGKSAPTQESGMLLGGVVSVVASVRYTSSGVSRSFTVSAPANGNPEVVSQLGEYSTTGGELIVSTNGMAVVSASGQVPLILQQGPIRISAQVSGQLSPNIGSISTLSSVTSAIPGLWMDASKRRSRSQIYVEILELMKRGPMTPFEIAFYARLNHKRTKQYTEFLKRSGYLDTLEEDGRVTYVLTKNGLAFTEKVKSLFQNAVVPSRIESFDF